MLSACTTVCTGSSTVQTRVYGQGGKRCSELKSALQEVEEDRDSIPKELSQRFAYCLDTV